VQIASNSLCRGRTREGPGVTSAFNAVDGGDDRVHDAVASEGPPRSWPVGLKCHADGGGHPQTLPGLAALDHLKMWAHSPRVKASYVCASSVISLGDGVVNRSVGRINSIERGR